MLAEEAEYWWENTYPRLERVHGAVIPWSVFREAFLEKYFPEDVRNRKEMEFLELKQEGTTVAEYAAKFESLVRYFPQYQGEDGERSKCVKFINGLRPEIKMVVNCHGIRDFSQLVNMCRVFDEDQRAKNTFYRSVGPSRDKRQMPQGRGRPFSTPSGQFGGQSSGQRIGGFQPAPRGF